MRHFNNYPIYSPTVPITVGYEFTVYTTSEGEGMVELSVIIFDPPSGGAPRPFTLSINTEDGTAGIYMCSYTHLIHVRDDNIYNVVYIVHYYSPIQYLLPTIMVWLMGS